MALDRIAQFSPQAMVIALGLDAYEGDPYKGPVKYPDYYGVDTPDQNELLASKHNLESMRKYINATTLQFLSLEGLYKSMGYEKRNSSYPQFTDHCFTGDYPVKPIDANNKDFVDNQLSFMSSKS